MRHILIFLSILCISSSCTEDEPILNAEMIEGSWNLISVSCECQPVDLESGEHIWNFDVVIDKLIVTNNVSAELHTILATGNYDIAVTETHVALQGVDYDYYFEDGNLFLSNHPESDGPLIKFVRSQNN